MIEYSRDILVDGAVSHEREWVEFASVVLWSISDYNLVSLCIDHAVQSWMLFFHQHDHGMKGSHKLLLSINTSNNTFPLSQYSPKSPPIALYATNSSERLLGRQRWPHGSH